MRIRWADDLVTALDELGGEAHLSEIYPTVRKIRLRAGRSVPPTLKQTVQGALERHSRASENFDGEELFEMVSKYSGWYRLARNK